MSLSLLRVLPFATAACVWAAPASAQIVRGKVIDNTTFLGVVGAGVTALDSAGKPLASTLTDSTGAFALRLPAPGTFRLRTSALGYRRAGESQITLSPGDETTRELRLVPDPLPVDSITVMAQHRVPWLAREGFYRRQADGWGHFLDEKAIEAKAPSRFTDLLYGRRGVGVVCSRSQGSLVCDARTRGCPPTVVLDGSVLRVGGRGALLLPPKAPPSKERPAGAKKEPPANFLMDEGDGQASPSVVDELLNPFNLAAIEVYPSISGVPVQYTGALGACGAIIAWSKKR